jgi:sarcosine oxidase subunit gamma
MFERRSALTATEARAGTPAPQRLTIGEARGFALLQAEAFADTLAALASAVDRTLGVDLPRDLSAPRRAGGYCVFKVGSERFWIVGPGSTPAASRAWHDLVRDAVSPTTGSITSLSHARTRLFIEGPAAQDVLSKGIALDLHPGAFPCDACALTGLEDTPVLLHHAAPQRYELYVLRTYAEWIWEWLTDAALP